MVKHMYAVICKECGTEYEPFVTFERLQELLIEDKCTDCGGTLRQKLTFGTYKMATGATRKPT